MSTAAIVMIIWVCVGMLFFIARYVDEVYKQLDSGRKELYFDGGIFSEALSIALFWPIMLPLAITVSGFQWALNLLFKKLLERRRNEKA